MGGAPGAARAAVFAVAGLALAAPDGPAWGDETPPGDPAAAGSTLGAEVRAVAGTREALRGNFINPLLGERPLATIDGSREFDAGVACPSSQRFLEILVQPGPGGGLSRVQVSQDLDLNGALDHAAVLPVAEVSGVCANGLIACRPGTWQDCLGYSWSAGPDGALALEPAPLARLGGCYCINAFCGQGLVWRNLSQVLGDLGGGAATAAAGAGGHAISRSELDGTLIRFYGQRLKDCRGASQDYARYRSDPGSLTPTARAQAPADPAYGLLEGLYRTRGGATARRNCTLRRQVGLSALSLDDIISYDGGTGALRPCASSGCIELVLGRIGDNYWNGWCAVFEEDVRFFVHKPERIRKATLVRAKWDDHIQVYARGRPVWGGPDPRRFPPESEGECELYTSWDQNPGVDFTRLVRVAGPIDFRVRVSVSGGGEGYAYAQVLVDESCDPGKEWIDDGCEALARDSACRLEEETTDGVRTVAGFAGTGLRVLPSPRALTEGACTAEVERDWWLKERTYFCEDGTGWDFSDALARSAAVQQSLAPDGTFRDRRLVDGRVLSEDGRVVLPELPTSAACERACKVVRSEPETLVDPAGPAARGRRDVLREESRYRICQGDACPLEPGETQAAPCGCLSDFTEALLAMQALRMAGSDLICTSGERTAMESLPPPEAVP